MHAHDTVCSSSRANQYRLLRIESSLYEKTLRALDEWRSVMAEGVELPEKFKVTTAKLAVANQRSLTRLNVLRESLNLAPITNRYTESL